MPRKSLRSPISPRTGKLKNPKSVAAGRKGGAPIGNDYSLRAHVWRTAILRAIQKRSRVGRLEFLEPVADKLLMEARRGQISALRELGDRLDGKAPQAIVGDRENPLVLKPVGEMTDEELEKVARGGGK